MMAEWFYCKKCFEEYPLSATKNLLNQAVIQRKMRLEKNKNAENNFLEEPVQAKSSEKFPEFCSFENYPEYKNNLFMRSLCEKINIRIPFFHIFDAIPAATIQDNGKNYINFASY